MSSQLSSSAQSVEVTGSQLLPWRDTNHSPLSATELKYLVVQAALQEEENDGDDRFLDVPGIAWMEHLNLIVGHTSEDRAVAESFYLDTMGMTPDKGKSFHVNIGRQQFHLATPKRDDEIPHRIHGSIGLVVPDLDTLWGRLEAARENSGFENTLFDFYKEEDGTSTTVIHVRCPWGNVFRCYSAGDRGSSLVADYNIEESPQKMTNLHSPLIGMHGADKMGVLSVGGPGIRYVEFVLPQGVKAQDVCDFYVGTVCCSASVGKSTSGVECCLVSVGAGLHLVYVEAPASSSLSKEQEDDLFHRMKGIHLCIYVHEFRSLYERLKDRSLVWTNPRFTHLDTCDTWEEAKKSRTLRFRHIADAENKVLMEMEHETRPLRHGQFLKVPYYVPK